MLNKCYTSHDELASSHQKLLSSHWDLESSHKELSKKYSEVSKLCTECRDQLDFSLKSEREARQELFETEANNRTREVHELGATLRCLITESVKRESGDRGAQVKELMQRVNAAVDEPGKRSAQQHGEVGSTQVPTAIPGNFEVLREQFEAVLENDRKAWKERAEVEGASRVQELHELSATLNRTINESMSRESNNRRTQIQEVSQQLINSCKALEDTISENHKSHVESHQQLESLFESEREARAIDSMAKEEMNQIIMDDVCSSVQRLEAKLGVVEELTKASSELRQEIEEIKHSFCPQ